MAHAGQFGQFYAQLAERFFKALELRYNDIQDNPAMMREGEIISKLLDTLLADQISHEVPLGQLEQALKAFQQRRHDTFTPKKYADILAWMNIEEDKTLGYKPMLYGAVVLEIANRNHR